MAWILLALLAHIGNGLVFIVDKSLLNTKTAVGKPIAYALYSASFAGLALLLIPWAHGISLTSFLLLWSFIAGVLHILALYIFFTAMRVGEPSRVVPITGSFVPLFTIILAVSFLGEQFTSKQFLGMIILIVGGMVLSMRASPRRGEVVLPVVAGLLFAIYFAVTKYIYTVDTDDFFGVFIVTRVVESLIALVGLGLVVGVPLLTKERLGEVRVRRSRRNSTPSNSPLVRGRVSAIFLSNKLFAAGMFMLQTYAIKIGSVSVVNSLQGVQYAFVFIGAIVVSLFIPKLFIEEINARIIIQKISGIILVSLGVLLLV